GYRTPDTASANRRFIDSSVDAALVEAICEDSKKLAESPKGADQIVPEIAIHPVRQTRGHPTERNHRVPVKFVQPHFVLEEPEQFWLREFQWIDVGRTTSVLRADFAIHPDAERDTCAHKHQRKKEHRLNQARAVKAYGFDGQVDNQPGPPGR